ncbi:MAG: tetratricopeptide repeat protein [Candidatus Melainabacteria bacterium]|nr:tetratricopeptide repeat protein [Candidatus Melainabacteria bacterium]
MFWFVLALLSVDSIALGQVSDLDLQSDQGALQESPSALTYRQRGLQNIDAGNFEEAIRSLSQAISLNDRDIVAYFQRGRAYTRVSNFRAALEDLDRAEQLFLQRWQASDMKELVGRIRGQKGRITTAIARTAFSILYGQGISHHHLGDLAKAEQEFAAACALAPWSPNLRLYTAANAYRMGDYDIALERLNAIIAANPSACTAFVYRGMVHERLGEFDKAFADRDRAVQLQPEWRFLQPYRDDHSATAPTAQVLSSSPISAIASLTESLQEAGKGPAGIPLAPGLSLSPGMAQPVNVPPPSLLAAPPIRRGPSEQGPGQQFGHKNPARMATSKQTNYAPPVHSTEAAHREALALSRDSDQMSDKDLLSDLKCEFSKSVQEFNRLLALCPLDANSYYSRGMALLCSGRPAQAASDFLRFIELVKWKNKSALFAVLNCYVAYSLCGQHANAQNLLQQAEKHCPNKEWPYPIITFLAGKTDDKAILAHAKDRSTETLIKYYVGLKERLDGRPTLAQRHFSWVRDNGDKRLDQYFLALSELIRIGKPVTH